MLTNDLFSGNTNLSLRRQLIIKKITCHHHVAIGLQIRLMQETALNPKAFNERCFSFRMYMNTLQWSAVTHVLMQALSNMQHRHYTLRPKPNGPYNSEGKIKRASPSQNDINGFITGRFHFCTTRAHQVPLKTIYIVSWRGCGHEKTINYFQP